MLGKAEGTRYWTSVWLPIPLYEWLYEIWRIKKIAHSEVGYFLDFIIACSGGEDGNRTRLNGFAGRLITIKIKYLA
jgi:hypothetical protein